MNINAIHVRLTLWYTVLVIVISSCFGAYTYYSLGDRLYKDMRTTLTRRAEHVRDNVLPQITSISPKVLAQEIKEVYSPEESSRFIRITRANGAVVYISGPPKDKSFNPNLISLYSNHVDTATEWLDKTAKDDGILIVALNAVANGNSYTIQMGAPTDQIEDALHKLAITLLIGLPVVMLAGIAGGLWLIRRALRPVETMRQTAEQITYSNLRQRIPVAATGDAIAHLAQTLNQMLERLEQSYHQASRFSADASHELRTPLAIIRTELESIPLTKGLSKDVNDRLGSILEEMERLSRIVEGLFAVARLDAGEAKFNNDLFNIADLVHSTTEQMQLLADDKRLSVTVDAPKAVWIRGDAARLKQVIVNLLDNAIKYTPAGGAITFSVYAEGMKAVLRVKDNGIGISFAALPHVFDRFYRADKVRSRDAQGAGLGLSIVRAICLAHGGDIKIQSADGAGTTVKVELPRANEIQDNTCGVKILLASEY